MKIGVVTFPGSLDEVDGDVTEERLAQIRAAAETLLSNPVIEDFTVRVEEPGGGSVR